MKLYVLLPSFNEEKALPCLMESLFNLFGNFKYPYEIIVVNDGSSDNTEDEAKIWCSRLNVKVINHDMNMGLGAAVNTGLSYVYESCSDEDVVVIMDADNTHNPELIPKMIEKIDNGSDVVIASRYEKGGMEIGLSFFRKLCSACASLLLSIFFNIKGVKDYTCGYRAYTGRIIKRAYDVYGHYFIEEQGFTCMAEILIKLSNLGIEVSEVPLILRYDLKKGKSKMKVISTIRRYFMIILKSRHYRELLVSRPAFIEGKEK